MVRNSSADGKTSSETRQSRARRRATVDALRSSRLFLCTVQAKKGRGGGGKSRDFSGADVCSRQL